jgi:hypothetical protein
LGLERSIIYKKPNDDMDSGYARHFCADLEYGLHRRQVWSALCATLDVLGDSLFFLHRLLFGLDLAGSCHLAK